MKILAALLTLIAALAGAETVPDAESAADLVFTEILDGNIQGRSVMVFPETFSQGETVETWHEEVTAPVSGYLVLIDDMAYANWQHPCRWVFVAQDGQMEVIRMTTPPTPLEEMNVTHTCLPESSTRDQYDDFLNWFEPNVQSTAGEAEHVYALIISGGGSSGSNYIRYYGDVQFIYNVLKYDYLLDDDHIVICFADGTDPAPDQYGGINSNPDFDDDGDTDINYDATTSGVESGFDDIASIVGADDHLFIFTTDHGGTGKNSNTPPEVNLTLWNTGSMDDDDWQTELENLTYASCHVVMEQCFSGGFLEETIAATTGSPSTFASAANGSESSWAGATYPEYNEYVYYWTGAMHGSIPPSSGPGPGALPGDPDMNGDGKVSFGEAFDRAKAWDSYAQTGQEHPQYEDDPDSCGDLYYLGGVIPTGIGNSGYSGIPATGGLAVLGNPISSISTVNFKMGSSAEAEISVYDMSGHVVQIIASDEFPAGQHSLDWNASGLSAGLYIIRFRTEDFAESVRAVKF